MNANPPPFLFQPGQRHYLRQRRWHILAMPRDVAEQLKPWPRAGVISIDGFPVVIEDVLEALRADSFVPLPLQPVIEPEAAS